MDPYSSACYPGRDTSKIFEGETKEDTADLISEYDTRRLLRLAERAAEDRVRREKAVEKQVGVGGRLIWDSKNQGTYRKDRAMGIEGIEQLGSSATEDSPAVPVPDTTPPGGDDPIPAPDTTPFEQGETE